MQEAEHLVPNWWCCLGFMWRPPSRGRHHWGQNVRVKATLLSVSFVCFLLMIQEVNSQLAASAAMLLSAVMLWTLTL